MRLKIHGQLRDGEGGMVAFTREKRHSSDE